MDFGEAYGYGDASELARILLNCIGVTREGSVAYVRVECCVAT